MGRVEFGAEEVTRKDGAKAWRPFIQFAEGEHAICFRCDTVAIRERLEKAGYAVLKDGRVFSSGTNWRGYGKRLMTSNLNSHGYPRVRLTVEGKRKTFLIHKLVLEIYIGPRPSASHEACHRDGNRENNMFSNLYWGTRKENAADRTRHGNCKGAENGRKSAHKLRGKRK